MRSPPTSARLARASPATPSRSTQSARRTSRTHPLHVLAARRREQRTHTAEKRTHHLGEPVIHGRPQSVDARRGGPGDGKLAQEALDALHEGVDGGRARDASEGEQRVLELTSRIHLGDILCIRSVMQDPAA